MIVILYWIRKIIVYNIDVNGRGCVLFFRSLIHNVSVASGCWRTQAPDFSIRIFGFTHQTIIPSDSEYTSYSSWCIASHTDRRDSPAIWSIIHDFCVWHCIFSRQPLLQFYLNPGLDTLNIFDQYMKFNIICLWRVVSRHVPLSISLLEPIEIDMKKANTSRHEDER